MSFIQTATRAARFQSNILRMSTRNLSTITPVCIKT